MTTVTIPAPGPWLAANQHTHWRNRHSRTNLWRDAATLHAKGVAPVASPFVVTATIWRTDRRRYDLDGIAVTVKACIDGIKAAGVIEDDDTRHMAALHLVHGGVAKGEPRVDLIIAGLPS